MFEPTSFFVLPRTAAPRDVSNASRPADAANAVSSARAARVSRAPPAASIAPPLAKGAGRVGTSTVRLSSESADVARSRLSGAASPPLGRGACLPNGQLRSASRPWQLRFIDGLKLIVPTY
jgi:hypothetical protein